jgi:hypothetical protein
MPPQTYRTINRDNREAHSVTRSAARAVLQHDVTVIGSSVPDVVASAGGWLFDRRMAGWQVTVLLSDRAWDRALRILGANAVDLDGGLDTVASGQDHAATLAVAADVYAADGRVRRFVSTSDRSRAEVAMWGDTGSLGQRVSAVSYRLSAAAIAFKAQALMAAGLPADAVAATETLYRCGVTALAPAAR